MKNNNNAMIFTACHELTHKIVDGTKDSYSATFTICLRLAYRNSKQFITACRLYNVSISRDFAHISDKNFDVFAVLPLIDSDAKAMQKFNKMCNFAINYGLKKREAFIFKSEKKSGISDNNMPLLVADMRKNDFDDLKQDVALYLWSRMEDDSFIALPNIYKLMRAGDCVVTNMLQKNNRKKSCDISLENLEECGFERDFAITEKGFDDCTLNDYIYMISCAKQLPKKHRQLANDILTLRYTKNGKFVNKAMKIEQIAIALDISVRTVKTVLKEIRSLNPDTLRNAY